MPNDWALLLFYEKGTTYSSSYRPPPLHRRPTVTALPPLVTREKRTNVQRYKNYETLAPYKEKLPFDSQWTPKPIIRTRPDDVQKKIVKIHDDQLSEVMRTRPRLVMTPGISLDDIEDPVAREIIFKDTYLTTLSRAAAEVASVPEGVKAPRPEKPAPAKPIFLPTLQPCKVPDEWKKDSLSWDRRQLRSFVEPNREFWKPMNIYKDCIPCKVTAQVRELRKTLA